MKKLSILLLISCVSLSLFASSYNSEQHFSGFGSGYSINEYKKNSHSRNNNNAFLSVSGPNFAIRGEHVINNTISYYSDLTTTIPSLTLKHFGEFNFFDFQLLQDYCTGINFLSSVGKSNYQYIGIGAHVNALIINQEDVILSDCFFGVYGTIGFKKALSDKSFLDFSYKMSYDFTGFSYNNYSNEESPFSIIEDYHSIGKSFNVFFVYEV